MIRTVEAQEETSKEGLRRDMASRLERTSRFYIGPIYFRVAVPMAGGKWQAYRCDTSNDAVLTASLGYATRNNAIRWAADSVPAGFYDGSDVDEELSAQFGQHYRVTVNGWDFVPTQSDETGTFLISTHPSTAEAMEAHRIGRLPSLSTRVFPRDASILRRWAFSRFSDLATFVTSKAFRAIASTPATQDVDMAWEGNEGAFVPTIVGIVRELADRLRMPAGKVFTGRTLDSEIPNPNATRRPAFDLDPHQHLIDGNRHDDVYLSFREGLPPSEEQEDSFFEALDAIVRRHFPDRTVDVIDDPDGTPGWITFAVRRTDTLPGRPQPARQRRPVAQPEHGDAVDAPRADMPRADMSYVDSDSERAFSGLMGEDEPIFAIRVVGLGKKAQAEDWTNTYRDATGILAGGTGRAEYCIERNRYGVRRNPDTNLWTAYTAESGRPGAIRSGEMELAAAIDMAAGAAHGYAKSHGYHAVPDGTTLTLMNEIRRDGHLRTDGYEVSARGPVGSEQSGYGTYVLERVPISHGPARGALSMSVGDIDMMANMRFSRERDAEFFLASSFEMSEWSRGRSPPSLGEMQVSAAADALRGAGLPGNSVFVSRAGWMAMSQGERSRACGGEQDRKAFLDNLQSSSPSVVAVLFDRASIRDLPQGLDQVVEDVRRRMGYGAQVIPDLALMLVDASTGSGARPESLPGWHHRPPPPITPEEQQEKPARIPGDSELYGDVDLPQDGEDFFGITFASAGAGRAGRPRRKPTVVSFDWDDTVMIADRRDGVVDYDEHGDPKGGTLNEDAAELMRLHAGMGDKIVIVTCRYPDGLATVWDAVREHGLPVSEAYATSHASKAPTLRSVGATIHYDDSDFRSDEIRRELGAAVSVRHADRIADYVASWGKT